MMSMFWNTASAVPAYHWVSDTRWLAGRMSKLSFRSGRKKIPAALQVADQRMGLVLGGHADAAMPELRALERAKSIILVLPPK
jgi:nanoRNase/pAp phosphatase (c-di-AMP/oligoRNAs hydrolase)